MRVCLHVFVDKMLWGIFCGLVIVYQTLWYIFIGIQNTNSAQHHLMNDGCTHFDTGVGWKLQGRVDINIFITVNILQEKKEGRKRHVSPFISFCIDSPVCGAQTKDNNLKTTDIFHLCKKSHLKQTVTVISNKSLKQKHIKCICWKTFGFLVSI